MKIFLEGGVQNGTHKLFSNREMNPPLSTLFIMPATWYGNRVKINLVITKEKT